MNTRIRDSRWQVQLRSLLLVVFISRFMADATCAAEARFDFAVKDASLLACFFDLRSKGIKVNGVSDWCSADERTSIAISYVSTNSTAEQILTNITAGLSGYVCRRDIARSTFLVAPTNSLVMTTQITRIEKEDMSLKDVLCKEIAESLARAGARVDVVPERERSWNRVVLDISFAGGSLGEFLDYVAAAMGDDVCWTASERASRTAPMVGDRRLILTRGVSIRFDAIRLGEAPPSLGYLNSRSLEDLASDFSEGVRRKSDVALELARRFRARGDNKRMEEWLARADKVAPDELRAEIRFKALELRIGWTASEEEKKRKAEKYKEFLVDCTDSNVRNSVEMRLLGLYRDLGMEEDEKALLKSMARRGPRDEARAAVYYTTHHPDVPPLMIDGRIMGGAPQKQEVKKVKRVEVRKELQPECQEATTHIKIATNIIETTVHEE